MFLNHQAIDRKVAASTQNQALSALVFLYKEVLDQEFGWLDYLEYAKRPERLPDVFSKNEVRSVLSSLNGVYWIIANILYGSGLRIMESLCLRILDIDFEYRQIIVRNGKGQKDRGTKLPEVLVAPFSYSISGRRSFQGWDCSSWAANLNRRASFPKLAVNCNPTGRPSSVQCRGTDMDGCPVALNKLVNPKNLLKLSP